MLRLGGRATLMKDGSRFWDNIIVRTVRWRNGDRLKPPTQWAEVSREVVKASIDPAVLIASARLQPYIQPGFSAKA